MGDTAEDKTTVIGYAEDCVNIDQPGQEEKGSEKVLIAEAQVGFADEKELGPLAALKTYSNAVLWSLVFAACVIMEGYDTALLGSFYAYRMDTTPGWMSGG
jgi:MFS transporter, SP family, general alpha glucoside:H+ symporter